VAALAVSDLAMAFRAADAGQPEVANDPMIAGRKTAGILVESRSASGRRPLVGGRLRGQLPTPSGGADRPPAASRTPPQPAATPLEALEVLAESSERWRDPGAAGFRRSPSLDGARPRSWREVHRPAAHGNHRGRRRGPGPRRRLRLTHRLRRHPPHHAGDVFFGAPDAAGYRAGNTNTLFAVHDGLTWISSGGALLRSTRTADEYAVWLVQLLSMSGLSLGQLDACIISSVVPQSLFNLRNLARRYLHVEPLCDRRERRPGHRGAHLEAVRGRRRPTWSTPSAPTRSMKATCW